MECVRLPDEVPAFYCKETGRAIRELFWGGWALYFCTTVDGRTVEGEHAGVALCYSSADAWLWGRDAEVYKVPGQSLAAPHN
jgi:hypothetical protein